LIADDDSAPGRSGLVDVGLYRQAGRRRSGRAGGGPLVAKADPIHGDGEG